MLLAARPFAVISSLVLACCTRFPETSLIGTWKTGDDTRVEEIACRQDHTFTRWTDLKNMLTTPSVPTSTGEWRIKGRQLVVHFSWTNGPSEKQDYKVVDGWAEEDKEVRSTLVKVDADTLLLKDFEEKNILTFRRVSNDRNVAPLSRAVADSDIEGTWRIRYNTHDYEMAFGKDHTVTDFAEFEGVRTKFHVGNWQIRNSQLTMEMESVPTFTGESISKGQSRWTVVGIEPQRMAIKDGPVPYVLQRVK
jgi:hypothetical protein